MPPVFGPVSPSPARLKSCAAPSGTACAPSQSANSETSSPSSSSSITNSPPNAATARNAASTSSARPADEHALAGCEAVRLDDAGGARDRERLGGRHAGRAHHVLRERLRSLDPRRRRARAEDGDPVSSQLVGDAGDERRLGADHDEVGLERQRQAEQAVAVVGAHRMAASERGDAGVARRCVQLGQAGALREAPRERVLARARADDQHLHAARLLAS